MTWRIYTTVQSKKEIDWNYGLYITALQSQMELWLGIIAANLPTLAPLSSQLLVPKIKSYFNSTRSSSKQRSTQVSTQRSASGRMLSRVVGGGDMTLKREKFTVLKNDDLHLEMGDTRNLNKIESSVTNRSISADGRSWNEVDANEIDVRREFDVYSQTLSEPPRQPHAFSR
jgi:hypothetical protein